MSVCRGSREQRNHSPLETHMQCPGDQSAPPERLARARVQANQKTLPFLCRTSKMCTARETYASIDPRTRAISFIHSDGSAAREQREIMGAPYLPKSCLLFKEGRNKGKKRLGFGQGIHIYRILRVGPYARHEYPVQVYGCIANLLRGRHAHLFSAHILQRRYEALPFPSGTDGKQWTQFLRAGDAALSKGILTCLACSVEGWMNGRRLFSALSLPNERPLCWIVGNF